MESVVVALKKINTKYLAFCFEWKEKLELQFTSDSFRVWNWLLCINITLFV
jgi:hypothetical protein